MNGIGLLFLILTAGLLLVVPRRLAPLPFLIAATYLPRSQFVDIGSAYFPVLRLLVAVGLLRVLVRSEGIAGRFNLMDRFMVCWGIWLICSGAFHDAGIAMWRYGDAYTYLGTYFLFRVFLQEIGDVRNVVKMGCILLLPLAAGMLMEKVAGKNYIAGIFGESQEVAFRSGHYRARGPYANAILAGTVGAVWLPMAFYYWQENRKIGILGIAAAGIIVLSSGASGPVMTALAGLGAFAFWRYRIHLHSILKQALLLVVALSFVMKRPVYFLVAYIDISGGSTGWYRAILIQGALEHLNEWWLVGTDQTLHWVPEGTSGVVGQADITNMFIQMGVQGGLLLMFLFVAVLVMAFRAVGRALNRSQGAPLSGQLLIWMLGSVLFAHTVTFWSVAYFEPSLVLLFYLLVAALGSLDSMIPENAAIPLTDETLDLHHLPKTALSRE